MRKLVNLNHNIFQKMLRITGLFVTILLFNGCLLFRQEEMQLNTKMICHCTQSVLQNDNLAKIDQGPAFKQCIVQKQNEEKLSLKSEEKKETKKIELLKRVKESCPEAIEYLMNLNLNNSEE